MWVTILSIESDTKVLQCQLHLPLPLRCFTHDQLSRLTLSFISPIVVVILCIIVARTWCSVVWSNTSIDVAVKVFLQK